MHFVNDGSPQWWLDVCLYMCLYLRACTLINSGPLYTLIYCKCGEEARCGVNTGPNLRWQQQCSHTSVKLPWTVAKYTQSLLKTLHLAVTLQPLKVFHHITLVSITLEIWREPQPHHLQQERFSDNQQDLNQTPLHWYLDKQTPPSRKTHSHWEPLSEHFSVNSLGIERHNSPSLIRTEFTTSNLPSGRLTPWAMWSGNWPQSVYVPCWTSNSLLSLAIKPKIWIPQNSRLNSWAIWTEFLIFILFHYLSNYVNVIFMQ